MQPWSNQLTRSQWASVVAMVSTLMLHAMGLWALHRAPLLRADHLPPAYTERYAHQEHKPRSIQETREEIHRKNQDLAAIFNRSLQPTGPTQVENALSEQLAALAAPEMDLSSTMALGNVSGQNEGMDTGEGLSSERAEILLPDDDLLSSELTAATSALKGEWEIADWRVGKGPGLQVGHDVPEMGPAPPALKTHSGLLDADHLCPLDASFASAWGEGPASKGKRAEWLGEEAVAPLLTRGSRGDATTTEATIVKGDHFRVEALLAPSADNKGYLFRLQFYPRQEIRYRRIAKNVYFLIDRSQSISRQRYAQAKLAVEAALRQLHPDDTFNILVFDKYSTTFSDKTVPVNAESLAKADEFLANQGHGGFFAGTELYSSLQKILPETVVETEMNIAVLLSDGDTYLFREDQRKTILSWTVKNKGRVSLFSLASGKGNNLPLLDYLSTINKGWLIYVSSHDQQESALENLLETIRNPIGKRLSVQVVPDEPGVYVNLFPRPHRLSDLYERNPFTLYGIMNRPAGMRVFIRGKYYDSDIDILRYVTFWQVEARPSDELEREVAHHLLYEHFDRFLQDGKEEHLAEAKPLLEKFNFPMAFQ